MMSKADRIIYGTPVIQECNEVLRDFVLAYEYRDERESYMRKLVADFAVLKVDIEGINHEHVLREPKSKDHAATAVDLPATTDAMYLRTYEIIGLIDQDITKWRNSLRSKTDIA